MPSPQITVVWGSRSLMKRQRSFWISTILTRIFIFSSTADRYKGDLSAADDKDALHFWAVPPQKAEKLVQAGGTPDEIEFISRLGHKRSHLG